jgi:hypothetical protein
MTTMLEGSTPLPAETGATEVGGWDHAAEPRQSVALPMLEVPPRTSKLGRIAMTIAISVIALSVLASVLIGLFGTTIYSSHQATANGGSLGFSAQPDPVAFGFQALIGSIFGIWALVQGIVATAQNRGRKFGIVAIVVAGAGPLVSLVIWVAVGLAAGHNISL